MNSIQKLAILADAAKYDASCASSGTSSRNSRASGARSQSEALSEAQSQSQAMGSTSSGMGICHAYAPDGRCISLLKILLTNFCTYECSYCVNRNSSNVPRARFSVKEVVDLTLNFYKRNYIEGLFLSSGVIRSPDYTMAQLVEVARCLREDHDFRGYIHLKTIPDADGELLTNAGRYADRLSINVELPSRSSLQSFAPQKDHRTIKLSMARIRSRQEEDKAAAKEQAKSTNLRTKRKAAPRFAPAGQSTQMIIGADPSDDAQILRVSSALYTSYRLRRVYYSAFSPIPDSSNVLPLSAPPLLREHRLYQSDWLMRFYGYTHNEITSGTDDIATDGMLSLDVDPKLGWALRNRHYFPVDLNRGSREQLLRVPGLGVRTVDLLIKIRRRKSIDLADLASLRTGYTKALPFMTCKDHYPQGAELSSAALRAQFTPQQQTAFSF